MTLNTDTVLLLVVGAHLQAEINHRPLAQSLRDRMLRWQKETGCDAPLTPVICTDLWYLNDTHLLTRPAITIGEPGLNAATAYLAARLPVAFVVEGAYQLQLDVEYVDSHACIWGTDERSTAAGVDRFIARYLDGFLRAAHDMAGVNE